ncbi:YadA C-terminal domain-containing protein [Vibrio lentus]|uniref:YadA C-terminal domain-containing protein n=1 Tax=Vibrio lentus TaxID=136468 RepID=UPI000CC9CFB7|nr:YadA C-terminal domain-containing protein [Vibrio lentus]PMJ89044.1 hypothetical protein BCU14_04765 [Vibrio lentus]PMN36186.1 hypothetical protein BCT33_11210 [Vibrio lentus]PMN57966.1 hypothetical protein BCT29_04095 [Vibrio lentus]
MKLKTIVLSISLLSCSAFASNTTFYDNWKANTTTALDIIANSNNEAIKQYTKDQFWARDGQERADSARNALQSASREELIVMSKITLNEGSSTEKSMLESMVTDVIHFDETISQSEKNALIDEVGKKFEGNEHLTLDERKQVNDAIETAIVESAIENNAIDEAFKQEMRQEVDRLDDRIDGTQASLHAVTNARPMLAEQGDFAMGVGVGFSGNAQAVAAGVGYSINKNWSASATVNTTTGIQDNDFSAGAGIQYTFK